MPGSVSHLDMLPRIMQPGSWLLTVAQANGMTSVHELSCLQSQNCQLHLTTPLSSDMIFSGCSCGSNGFPAAVSCVCGLLLGSQ